MARRPRLAPSTLVVLLGIGFAAVVAASGIVATLAQQHDESPISRTTFLNIPSAMRGVFYALLTVLFIAVGWLFSLRVQNWQRGQPDRRATTTRNVKRRLESFRRGIYMQTLLRDPAAGVMHSLIYFPFIILFAVTTVLEINHQLPASWKFLHGDVYRGYALTGDVAGVLFLVGVFWAIGRRYIRRPFRLRTKTRPEDALIL